MNFLATVFVNGDKFIDCVALWDVCNALRTRALPEESEFKTICGSLEVCLEESFLIKTRSPFSIFSNEGELVFSSDLFLHWYL